MDDDYLPPIAVQDLTGVSIAALAQLRHRGLGPRYYKPTPRTVLYKRSEVVAWIEGSVRQGIRELA
ncbi:hypothetical protein GCM10009840_04190 [Pseudolysinimonas kribbensis]|uniref:DNA-binding protein n=1 Tax=Pseudolysinimonas kribbensis TaxID=433641 RepID=A0ABQ6K2R2_9MICO|nr:hypothetical protein [Pseudolysinimonas kribbensis]GMA94748.1 hypothetical protein GCM10025881_15720 [Pseudolysinimonas kribbensis]